MMGHRATEWSQSLFPCGKQSHPSVLQDTYNFHRTSTTQCSALTDVEALINQRDCDSTNLLL